jgi:hypothetical protein
MRASRWSQPGSNRRPRACHARALPTELWPQERPQSSLEVELICPIDMEPLIVSTRSHAETNLYVTIEVNGGEEKAPLELRTIGGDDIDLA